MEINQNTQYLGGICKRGHDFSGTGQSLRKLSDRGCIQCCAEGAKKRYAKNPDLHREQARRREQKNKEKSRLLNTERKRRSRQQKAEHHRAYAREYYRKNSIRVRLRNRLSFALRQQKIIKNKTFDHYGLDVAAIMAFLGPCPGDLKNYDIDHIVPLSSFNLSDERQIRVAFAPENHQWLTKRENMEKHAKLNWRSEYEVSK
jgi:hypothetical protein